MEGHDLSPKTHQTPLSSAIQIVEAALSPSKTAQSETVIIDESTKDQQSPEKAKKPRKWRRVKKKKQQLIPTEIMEIPGVRKIILSPLAEKIIQCIVGEHVTSEYPWKYVKREALADNLELHEESSEFLPFKEEIIVFPREEVLMIYIPDEMREFDEFFICLTEAAEEAVLEVINKVLQEREERLNNSIWKNVGEWKTLGSETEVNKMLDRNNRPLLEVEIETEYPVKPTKVEFRLRMVENAKDGYAELLCTRQTFSNLERIRNEVGVQVTPNVVQNGTQTVCFRRNAFTQYEFEYPPIKGFSKEFLANIQYFLDHKMSGLSETLYVNSNIDFYKDDYADLIRDLRYTSVPRIMLIKPYSSFVHPLTCEGKEIVCHSWHQMWSGIVAIAYAYHKPTDYRKVDANEDEVTEAMYNVTPVLLWSFQDHLEPKLFLETPREITQLCWCPYDENILVGGCVNGQVVIWDVTDKLKGVEEEEILPIQQRQYRLLMNSLMGWMKITKDVRRVRPTVVSELEYSQGDTITSIIWLSAYRELSKSGQVKDIPEEENRTSLQFITSSTDGTVLVWDMLVKPSYTTTYRPQRRLRRLKKRPSALTVAVSPFRPLNRVFKPVFKVLVHAPNSTRLLPITDVSIRSTRTIYVEKYPEPSRIFNITDRILYKPVLVRPVYPLVNQFVAGSAEGDFFVATWDGFEFNAGAIVNKETSTLANYGRYHDGPIVAISRSDLFPDLILTVGGKVFAIWKLSYIGKPVIWRRGKVRYTDGVWNTLRPAIFRLSREDGNIEMWHLRNRSDRYTSLQFTTRKGLGKVSTHPRAMKQNIIGVVAAKGLYELFYVSHDLTLATEEDKWSTYRLCERALERKANFLKWQQNWLLKHAEEVKAKQEQALLIQQEREEAIRREKEDLKQQEADMKKEVSDALATASTPQPGHFQEWAHEQLLLREKERMVKEMLRKKHLDMDVLLKQQIPVIKFEQEQVRKKANQEKRARIAEKMFDDTVAMLFPEAIEKKPPPPPDPYAGGDSHEVKMHYFKNYLAMSEECENYVRTKEYNYRFNWLTVLQSGKERRKSFEAAYNRYTHKLRILKEKLQRQEPNVTYSYAREESQTSLGSIDYGIPSDTLLEADENNVVPKDEE